MADQDKKGFSLRNKKTRRQGPPQDRREPAPFLDRSKYPSQERPSGESNRSGQNGPSPQPRPRSRPKNEATSNMVKKRFSMRYAEAPDIGLNSPPMPGVPQIPKVFAQDDRRQGTPQPQAKSGVDKRALRDPNLKTDQYITAFLAQASEQDIVDYQRNLRKEKNRASTDLQANVYNNRTQFIKISKEAERLKGEMQSLRGLMGDLTTAVGQAAASTGDPGGNDFDTGARKRANRSSLANLEAMWNTQLQTLWRTIEGSQKFLAAIPGRHVVQESGHWVELDPATWKNRRGVHIVLLNDHLLVAARKPKRVDTNNPKAQRAHTKLVATKCWALQEIDLINVAYDTDASAKGRDYAQIADAVTVRHGLESFTFRSDRGNPQDKNDLLTSFRRTLDELRRAEKAENKDSGVKSKEAADYLAARDPAISRSPGLLRTLSKSKDRPDMLIDVQGKQRNLRWVEGQIDELDIEIALQRFEEAVGHVETLRDLAKSLKTNTIAQEIITVKVDERAGKLADIITNNLIYTHTQLTPTQTHISHLTRLDFASRARHAYLSARTATIHARARQCVFEGDVLAHITNISYACFTLVKNTVATYTQCFPASMTSACVVWAKGELDKFNEALERALSGVEKGGEVWREGLERARDLASRLKEVGVDFEGLVGKGLE